MNRLRRLAVAGLAVAALSACGKKEPSGQVVATVGKEEITATELRNELGGVTAPTPQARKALEQRALQTIVNRKVVAQAARKAGVAKSPQYAQQEERMKELLLAQMWQSNLVNAVPAPSREETDRYISEHPDLFAQRKVFLVDQLVFAPPRDQKVADGLKPLNTLADVEAYLRSNNMPFRATNGQIDALAAGPDLVAQIQKLPAESVFVIPTQNGWVANHVREVQVQPVVGDQASKIAAAIVKNQRTQEAVQRQFGSLLKAAEKDVKYSKAYQPAKPAAAPAPKAK